MFPSRKRKCSNDDAIGNEREHSSYAKMKLKMNNVQHELGQLRLELMEMQQKKAEIEAALEKVRKEQEERNRNQRGSSKGGQSSYAKLKTQLQTNQYQTTQVRIELQDTQRIKLVCEDELVKVRMDLVTMRMELQEAQRRECEFKSVVHLLRTELQELTKKNEEDIKGMEEKIKRMKITMGLRMLRIEKLKATITAGDIRYDCMVARVEQSQRTMESSRRM